MMIRFKVTTMRLYCHPVVRHHVTTFSSINLCGRKSNFTCKLQYSTQYTKTKNRYIQFLYFNVYVRLHPYVCCAQSERQADMLTDSQKRISCRLQWEANPPPCPHLTVSLPDVCLSQNLADLTCSVSELFFLAGLNWENQQAFHFLLYADKHQVGHFSGFVFIFHFLHCFELFWPVQLNLSKI